MISEITLTVDASRIRSLVNLFSEMFEAHKEIAEKLGCLNKEQLEEWTHRFKQSLQVATYDQIPTTLN